MRASGPAHRGGIAVGAGGRGVKGAAWAELAGDRRLDGGAYVGEMRRAVALEDTRQAGDHGERPSGQEVVAEAEARDRRVAAGAQQAERVEAGIGPAAETERLQHQGAGVAGSAGLDRHVAETALFEEGERERIRGIYAAGETLKAGDRPAIEVVVEAGAALHEVTEAEERVQRQVGDRDDQRAAGDVGAPRVVHFHVLRLRRDVEAPIGELDDAGAVGGEPGGEIRVASIRVHVAGWQEVDASIVGEEELAGVEARGRREAPAAGGGVVVRDVGQVGGAAGDQVRPAGVAGDGGEQQRLLHCGERRRRVA